jgi:DnaJ-class molecular chaperone
MSCIKTYTTCTKCNGTGWQKRENKFYCEKCDNKNCYLCENVSKMNWETCVKCFGAGKIENKKKVASNTI